MAVHMPPRLKRSGGQLAACESWQGIVNWDCLRRDVLTGDIASTVAATSPLPISRRADSLMSDNLAKLEADAFDLGSESRENVGSIPTQVRHGLTSVSIPRRGGRAEDG